MKKYSTEWHALNTLLSYLLSADVVQLVNEHYQQFGNDAPGKLMKRQIELCEEILDKAEHY